MGRDRQETLRSFFFFHPAAPCVLQLGWAICCHSVQVKGFFSSIHKPNENLYKNVRVCLSTTSPFSASLFPETNTTTDGVSSSLSFNDTRRPNHTHWVPVQYNLFIFFCFSNRIGKRPQNWCEPILAREFDRRKLEGKVPRSRTCIVIIISTCNCVLYC